MNGITFTSDAFNPVDRNASVNQLSIVEPFVSQAVEILGSQKLASDKTLARLVLVFSRSIIHANNSSESLREKAGKLHARALSCLIGAEPAATPQGTLTVERAIGTIS